MTKAKSCKTFIRRFDPGPRLQSNRLTNKALSLRCPKHSDTSEVPCNPDKKDESQAKSLTATLTGGLTARRAA